MRSGGRILKALKQVAKAAFAADTQDNACTMDVASLVVRDYQRDKMNEHLNDALLQFDDRYEQDAGQLGTPEHLKERSEFAEFLAHQLVALQKDDPRYIGRLVSQVEHTTASGVLIGVIQCNTWDGSIPKLELPS